MEMLSGGEMIIRALEDEGVEYIFGYPGGAALHIYDALFKAEKLPHILVRHEQAATHAADGYARATGKDRRGARDLGSGCDQCDYWHCHRLYGFYPDGRDLWPSTKPFDWGGCFSRDRYDRRLSSYCEAQFSGPTIGRYS